VVQAFVKQHLDAYLQLRLLNGRSEESAESLLLSPEPEIAAVEATVHTARRPSSSDPARVAAGCPLRHALDAAGTSFEEAGRDGAVCFVVLPDSSWTKVVRDEWRAQARSGERYQDGDRDRHGDDGQWAAWMPEEPPRPSAWSDANETFAHSISQGRHCAGFAADIDWLPSDLVHAADHRLTLPTLTAGDVTRITNLLCGQEPTERLSPEQAAMLTPRLLRLARRRDQTADLYVRKLREVLRRVPPALAAQVSGAAGSPREAPTLQRLFGMDEAVAFGLDVARDVQDFKDGKIPWSAVDKGALLSGPSGCGKALFARALAVTAGVPLVTGSYSQWLANGSGHQGDLLIAMRKTFRAARAQAPCVLFLDEVDSFPDRGKISHRYADWEIQVVNALLSEIDGVESLEGVVILAACNHPQRLDPALVRSGRLNRHIRIRLPDRTALGRILREHLGADLSGADLSGAAMAASGASGADCERLVRDARRRARAAGRDMVMADLLTEIGGTDDRSPEDQWIAAVHEAGHVVATCVLRPGGIGAVSLQGSGEIGGMTAATVQTSAFVRPADLRERLVMVLAGRAAEEAVFGMPSSGAGGSEGSDLARATHLVVTSLAALGLDEVSGLVWRGRPEISAMPDLLATHPGLAERVRRVLDDAYAAARALISLRIAAVTALAQALVVRRVLDGPDAEAIVRRHSGQRGDQP
jgi:cell division protease FtsH